MKILLFAEGTILDDRDREGEWRMTMNAAKKLTVWKNHGATIAYLSSKRRDETFDKVRRALKEGGAPEGELLFRLGKEDYGEVAEKASPDIIVEDDCKSIGGEVEMTYPKLGRELKARVKSVVVPEWAGIDNLSDDPEAL
jgi:hypothetical protein